MPDKNRKRGLVKVFVFLTAVFVLSAVPVLKAMAGSPGGSFWFQIFTLSPTGGDDTGDGGDGTNLNYYYVGQSFIGRTDIGIGGAHPSNGADFILNYNKDIVNASSLTPLSAYTHYTGQSIDNVNGNLLISGYNDPTAYYSGQRQYADTTYTLLRPTAANYGTATRTIMGISYTSGEPTDSNIARDGIDYMDSKEDFQMYVWADTKAPYAKNPIPSSGSTSVAVDNNFLFDLRDSKNGEGDDSGVGTGVDTSMPAGSILVNDGTNTTSYSGAQVNFSCSGIWGTNLCNVAVNPDSPLGISGDTRHWLYNKTYTVQVGGFRDQASAAQNQLGDTNGPNAMSTKSWTFTTETDTDPPYAVSKVPAVGATGVSITSDITFDILDKKLANVSGSGVNSSTCKATVSSPSTPTTVFAFGSSTMAISLIDYGYHFDINPANIFGQNELVTVNISGCQDAAGNTMPADIYTFLTADNNAPYVDTQSPVNDASNTPASASVSFHIKDSGAGIDLSKTVIYVNGVYYTNDGRSNDYVTITGTRIPFTSSLKFTGGNYLGDITAVTCTGSNNDCTFTIKPQLDFTTGEAVPVIIYAQDAGGNLMDRVAYAFSIAGASCSAGSSYCGSNTSWNGSTCVGSGGGTCGGGGGGGGGGVTVTQMQINPLNVSVVQVNGSSVLLTWYSTQAGSGRVVYGSVSPGTTGIAPNYSYSSSTAETLDNSTYHSALISNLKQGILYYFKPVSKTISGQEVLGPEIKMAAMFGTTIAGDTGCSASKCAAYCEAKEVIVYKPAPVTVKPVVKKPVVAQPVKKPAVSGKSLLKVIDVLKVGEDVKIRGSAAPNQKLKIKIY